MLTGGAGVEPLAEREDAVTGEDIVDKLLFVVRILKERDDTHALKNKHAVGLLLQKSLKRRKDAT